jgi:uncharacterized protein YbaA (DUF1428 family)
MSYVDGFVLAVPTADREKYRQFAADVAPLFKDHGAVEIVECWGDEVPDGEVTSFPLAVKCGDDETVVFSWIVWPSREARDQGMEKIIADPRMQPGAMDVPFDGKRMIMGSFEVLLKA